MHACGHDGHAAILLNSVRLLCRRREELCGELRFIFQHAEETPGGAVEVIRAGVLKGVDEVFGLHLTSTLPTGSFGVCSGVLTSATDRFEIEITGRGGHSSMPQECIDPIVTGAQIILALQTVLSRSLRPSDPAVLSVCQAHSGSAYNIIPGSMHLTGSVRSYDERVRATAERRIREISEGIAASAGADVQVEYVRGYDSIRNDPALTGWARNMIAQTFGTQAVHELSPIAPGDDFCYYDQVCPGFFLELGAANPGKGSDAPHHNARYRLDEDAGLRHGVYSRSAERPMLFTGALRALKMSAFPKRETHFFVWGATPETDAFALAEWLGRSFVPAHSGRGMSAFSHAVAHFARAFARQLAKLAIEAGQGHIAHLVAYFQYRFILGGKHYRCRSDADAVDIIGRRAFQCAVKFSTQGRYAHIAELCQRFDRARLGIMVGNIGHCR